MRALRFQNDLRRIVATKLAGQVYPAAFTGGTAPVDLIEIPEPTLPAPDWVRVRTRMTGICGSDLKQVLLKGSIDNAMTALISFPHVLGHESVGVIDEVGPAVESRRRGERVLLNPWLSCAPRGIEPLCTACQAGDYMLCRNFDGGCLPAGIHLGTNAGAPGAFADSFVAHESQCFPVPETVSDEVAVLGDPFSVSLHSILKRPPTVGDTVLVYGLGPLGLLAVAALRHFYPKTTVYAVGKHRQQLEMARRFGAHEVLVGRPAELIEGVARLTGARLFRPWNGRPWLIDGVATVYDTVGLPQTIETAIRIVQARGSVVVSGVEAPRRFEWTPLYFKEVEVVGSNAFAIEEFEGRREHAMEIYLRAASQGLDLSAIVTHRYPLARWREAFQALIGRRTSGAIKVVLEPAA
jgi:threonine dehydrogenase-like Zn-dependent dehydrogenase